MLLAPYHANDDDDDNTYEDADQENKECLRLFAPYNTTDLFDSLRNLFGRVAVVVLPRWYNDHLGEQWSFRWCVVDGHHGIEDDPDIDVGLTGSHQMSWHHLWWQIIQLPILQPPEHVFSPVALDT